MTYEELRQKSLLSEGSSRLFRGDYEVLSKYASMVEPGNWCVDIGTYMGSSAEIMRLSNPESPILTVDYVELTTPEFKESYKGKIEFSVDGSKLGEGWNKPIGLLFIDGDHSAAKIDFDIWKDKVISGGYVLFHDFHPSFPWVVKDVMEILSTHENEYRVIYWPNLKELWDEHARREELKQTVIFQLQKL